jgi:hypothetical protein
MGGIAVARPALKWPLSCPMLGLVGRLQASPAKGPGFAVRLPGLCFSDWQVGGPSPTSSLLGRQLAVVLLQAGL